MVRNRVPGGDDEDVARRPIERPISDESGSLPFGYAKDRGIRGAIERAMKSFGKQLQKRAERGRDGSAGGIQVLDLGSMTRID